MIVPPTPQMINDLLSSMAYIGQAQGPDVGYAVGVASPHFKPFLALPGALLDQNGNPMTFDGDVPFELASISKVFTSALLTRLALRDPELWTKSITSCVPDGLPSLPAAFDPITLMDLANYTSGLPEDDGDTSIDVPTPLPSPFTELALYQYLHDGNVPVSGPGTAYTYSNLAPSLLAISLPTAVQSELSFGGLLAREITGPLGMTRTGVFNGIDELPLAMAGGAQASSGWDQLPAFNGGSGLVSTPNDMLTWLQFSMGLLDSPLNAILHRMQTPTNDIVSSMGRLGVGWFLASITATDSSGNPISQPIAVKAGQITTCSFICFVQSEDPGNKPSPLGMFLLTNNSVWQAGWPFAFQLMLAMLGHPNATNLGLGT